MELGGFRLIGQICELQDWRFVLGTGERLLLEWNAFGVHLFFKIILEIIISGSPFILFVFVPRGSRLEVVPQGRSQRNSELAVLVLFFELRILQVRRIADNRWFSLSRIEMIISKTKGVIGHVACSLSDFFLFVLCLFCIWQIYFNDWFFIFSHQQ